MANRLLGYRVALELDRRLPRRRRRPVLTAPRVAAQVLECVVKLEAAGGGADLAAWDDYALASRAGVSVGQTRELYEEVGLGALVREALDHLREQRLVDVSRRPPSGPYRGFAATAAARETINLDPWYKRALAFFDPPKGG